MACPVAEGDPTPLPVASAPALAPGALPARALTTEEAHALIDKVVAEIKELLDNGRIDRPDEPSAPTARPVRGSAIPKAGRRFGGEAPQGA